MGEEESSRREARVPCLLDVRLDLWGLEEAIWCKQQSVECVCDAIIILVPSAFGDEYLLQGTECIDNMYSREVPHVVY